MRIKSILRYLHRLLLKLDKRPIQTKYPQYRIGRGTYGDPEIFSWGEQATLEIGSYCSIANNVKIFLGGEHRIDWVTTYPFSEFKKNVRHIMGHPSTKGDVIIGNDVWIAYGATIMSGVKIGDGAVIGTQSVVTQDVSPYAIVAGNPAREIKKRFPDHIIEQLLTYKWWSLDDKTIDTILPLLLSDNIDELLNYLKDLYIAPQ